MKLGSDGDRGGIRGAGHGACMAALGHDGRRHGRGRGQGPPARARRGAHLRARPGRTRRGRHGDRLDFTADPPRPTARASSSSSAWTLPHLFRRRRSLPHLAGDRQPSPRGRRPGARDQVDRPRGHRRRHPGRAGRARATVTSATAPTPSSCAKARPSPTSCTPTAWWWAPTTPRSRDRVAALYAGHRLPRAQDRLWPPRR